MLATLLTIAVVIISPLHHSDNTFNKYQSPHHLAKHLVIPVDYAAWSHVAKCESGGWHVLGSAYPDSLGITSYNWEHYGKMALGKSPAPQAYTGLYSVVPIKERIEAIKIADEINNGHPPPEAYGACADW
jgi:hypothetical protein